MKLSFNPKSKINMKNMFSNFLTSFIPNFSTIPKPQNLSTPTHSTSSGIVHTKLQLNSAPFDHATPLPLNKLGIVFESLTDDIPFDPSIMDNKEAMEAFSNYLTNHLFKPRFKIKIWKICEDFLVLAAQKGQKKLVNQLCEILLYYSQEPQFQNQIENLVTMLAPKIDLTNENFRGIAKFLLTASRFRPVAIKHINDEYKNLCEPLKSSKTLIFEELLITYKFISQGNFKQVYELITDKRFAAYEWLGKEILYAAVLTDNKQLVTFLLNRGVPLSENILSLAFHMDKNNSSDAILFHILMYSNKNPMTKHFLNQFSYVPSRSEEELFRVCQNAVGIASQKCNSKQTDQLNRLLARFEQKYSFSEDIPFIPKEINPGN